MSDESPDASSLDPFAGGASDLGGEAASPINTQRDNASDTGSPAESRPASATPVRPTPAPARTQVYSDDAVASEASKAAAAEAHASVLKAQEGGGAVPNAPAGLLSYAAGGANDTLLGMGTAPDTEEVALVTVPRLDDLIIKTLADNYHVCPAFDWIPAEYLDNVVALLQPGKLDFAASAALVSNEKYWSRLSCGRWDKATLNLALHGQSWKRLYCEKHITECLEKYHHSKQQHNYKRLVKEIDACKPYVHTLHLRELMSHLDLSDLLFDFPHLSTLDLKFGARDLGMDYDKGLFGLTISDSLALSKMMARTDTIHRLTLSENLMTDESVVMLMNGLHPSVNRTLTYLDLSHNKIGDIGARKLCALLDGGLSQDASLSGGGIVGSVLSELYLQDNAIRGAGAVAFGAALANNRGLRILNLGLNALGDDGGVALLNGLTQHMTLETLAVSACDLEFESSESLVNLLRFNRSLVYLDLSCNELHGKVGGAAILEAVRSNDHIVTMDTRRNDFNAEVDTDLKSILAKRLAKQKQAARKAFQKDWDDAM